MQWMELRKQVKMEQELNECMTGINNLAPRLELYLPPAPAPSEVTSPVGNLMTNSPSPLAIHIDSMK